MSTETTTFKNKCDILAELWIGYKQDVEFEDFIAYNDVGLPLSYLISTEIVEPTPKSEIFVNETFDLFLRAVGVEDSGFENLHDIMITDGE